MFRMKKSASLRDTRAGQTKNHWRPKFFDSHGLTSSDHDVKVADIAYAAACVPGLRSLRGGLGDGASFNANPSVGAVAHLLEQWEACVEFGLELTEKTSNAGASDGSPREQIRRILSDGLDIKKVEEAKLKDRKWVETAGKGVVLGWTRVLSVGSGQALPALGYSNIDVGFDLWQKLPTNPFDGVSLPSNLFALDAPATAAEFTLRRLLDDERSLRLNPDLMPIPTVMASMMAINPVMRAYITRMIYDQTDSEKSKTAVARAAQFIEEQGIHGTGWYAGAAEGYKEKLAAWRKERDARAEHRRRQNPWNAWMAPRS
jgi:hypothetical protein